jgi:phosphoribosylformimino-5-aminoimidazole carboxamide ribotide isomerase
VQIIPAIDLKSGRCVRLRQGRDEATTEYAVDPLAVAREWERQGAQRIHMVNLDGAFGRASDNLEVLRAVAQGVRPALQFGGGLRTLESMETAIAAGASKIVLGTVAVDDPDLLRVALARFGPERIIVALDSVGGKVATRGWTVVTDRSALDLARLLFAAGVREVLSTDVARDGMLGGPNLTELKRLASAGPNILASGGIASVEDVRAIVALGEERITGAIVGKALYEGRVTLPELVEASQSE